jgi:hypothetical protein
LPWTSATGSQCRNDWAVATGQVVPRVGLTPRWMWTHARSRSHAHEPVTDVPVFAEPSTGDITMGAMTWTKTVTTQRTVAPCAAGADGGPAARVGASVIDVTRTPYTPCKRWLTVCKEDGAGGSTPASSAHRKRQRLRARRGEGSQAHSRAIPPTTAPSHDAQTFLVMGCLIQRGGVPFRVSQLPHGRDMIAARRSWSTLELSGRRDTHAASVHHLHPSRPAGY